MYFSPPNQGTSSGSHGQQAMMPPLQRGHGGAGGLGQMGAGMTGGGQMAGGAGMPGGAGAPGGAGVLGGVGVPGAEGQPGAEGGVPGGVPGAEGGAPGALPNGGAAMAANVTPVPDPNLPPPDGAQGPPPDEVPSAPAGTQQQSGSRLEKHLRIAGELWRAQATVAKASSKDGIKALVPDIEAHAQSVPGITDHMPPMQEVAGYLAASRVLLDRMSAAGMDVADLSLQVDMMMRPPKGKIPGGPKGAQAAAGK